MTELSIFLGMVLDAIFGDPYNIPHPVIFIGKLILQLEKKLNRRINQTVPTHTTQSQFDTDYSNGKLRDGLYIIDEEVQNG